MASELVQTLFRRCTQNKELVTQPKFNSLAKNWERALSHYGAAAATRRAVYSAYRRGSSCAVCSRARSLAQGSTAHAAARPFIHAVLSPCLSTRHVESRTSRTKVARSETNRACDCEALKEESKREKSAPSRARASSEGGGMPSPHCPVPLFSLLSCVPPCAALRCASSRVRSARSEPLVAAIRGVVPQREPRVCQKSPIFSLHPFYEQLSKLRSR